ncbi:GtrA family protein [Collimonas humicola]|uniref:GtrA family protein n=1 Tax=Collimonas humicola TaxID=2825886 RepID=UPI001B8CABB6|nr:GtrA family protein [Collimonas humicola]
MNIRREFLIFGIVGTAGFLVDAGVLYLLKGWLGLYWARVPSFICAATATWLLNRRFTFRNRVSGMSMAQEYARYFGLMLGGGVVNYLVYAIALSLLPAGAYRPLASVALGSIAGMFVNYCSARYFVFRRKPG